MKKYGIRDLARYAGMTIKEANRLLAVLGIIGGPDSQYLTDYGKRFGEDKWIDNDRYGRYYWHRVYNSEVIQMLIQARKDGK